MNDSIQKMQAMGTSGGELSNGQAMFVQADWINGTSSNIWQDTFTTACWHPNHWHWAEYRDRKITLKMSEIDKLRKAAKENKDLKDILNKFTPLIEVEIDF